MVGYSWVDSHIYQTANQGVGAGLAGRRALLVIIGTSSLNPFLWYFLPVIPVSLEAGSKIQTRTLDGE